MCSPYICGFHANNNFQPSPLASSTASPAASQSASSGGSKPLVWTGYDDRGFTTIYTSYPGTTQAPVTQLPTTQAVAQPTSTAKISADLALENTAAETAPPVPKANAASALIAGLVTSPMYLITAVAVIMGASWTY